MKHLLISLILLMGCSDTVEQKKKNTVIFESIGRITTGGWELYRTKVPYGWLVVDRYADSTCFIPDPKHEWINVTK